MLEQVCIYDVYVGVFSVIYNNLDVVMWVVNIIGVMGMLNGQVKFVVCFVFESVKQCFFGYFLILMKILLLICVIENDFEVGYVVVIQIVLMGEVLMECWFVEILIEEWGDVQVDIILCEYVFDYFVYFFLVQFYEFFIDLEGNFLLWLVFCDGQLVESCEVVICCDWLIEKFVLLLFVFGVFDQIVQCFGMDMVVEVIGCLCCVICKGDWLMVENCVVLVNFVEIVVFMDDVKCIFVFFDVGGMGWSYYVELLVWNCWLCVYYLFEFGWKVDVVI